VSEQQDSQTLPDYRLPDDLIISGIREAAAPGNWGIEACKIADLRAVGGDGEGEVVAVLDTGATVDHPEFVGRWHATPMSFVPGESYQDGHGHGTHCLGSAAGSTPGIGVANRAKLLAGKCLSNQGSGLDSWIYNSVKWAWESGATVISLSIGGGGYSAQMDSLFKQVTASGCVIVAASGNERQQGGQTTYPGRYESALAVAAVDSNGKFASFSNPGQTVETLAIAAPGVGIWSAMPGGGYQQMSGTSMATPFVAGVIAAYQSARVKAGLPRMPGANIRTVFRGYAIDAGATGIDRDYGSGLISGAALARTLVQVPEVK
jgi:subtilisin family serine protease